MVINNTVFSEYEFTTKDLLEKFTVEEEIISIKIKNSIEQPFYFKGTKSYLTFNQKKYSFKSDEALASFAGKLFINRALYAYLSRETFSKVINEVLSQMVNINLVIDKNTNQILTIMNSSANLISWRKIIETVYEVFKPIGEKRAYITTFDGLNISISMSKDEHGLLDIINIAPQSYSSIVIRRSNLIEQIPLKGYSEDEVLGIFKEKLQSIVDFDLDASGNSPLVRD